MPHASPPYTEGPIPPEPCVIETDRPLAPLTTWKIGGPADHYAEPATPGQLAWCYRFARDEGLPLIPMGGASNMLVHDAGVRGLVVRYFDRSAIRLDAPGEVAPATSGPDRGGAPPTGSAPSGESIRLRVGARVLFARLARQLARDGWSGLEWAEGIPGTVGGAVVGNAGAYGGEIAERIDFVEVYVPATSRVARWSRSECAFAYRTSRFKAEGPGEAFVLAACLCLSAAPPDEILSRMDRIRERRKASSPSGLSCGSVFQNPPGDHAGRIVESLGFKGRRIGGAEVSTVHGNYIVNRGGATASDVAALIDLIRDAARERLGIELVPEVRLVGF